MRSVVVAIAVFYGLLITLPLDPFRGRIQASVFAAIDALGWVPHDLTVSIETFPLYIDIRLGPGPSIQGVAPPLWLVGLLSFFSESLLTLPAMWVALFFYHEQARRIVWLDGITRCGHCGAALRNLEEARCPSCSRRI